MTTKPRSPHRWTARTLGLVFQALADSTLHERWIDDEHGVLGIQEQARKRITVSRQTMAPTVIHEALHAIFPKRDERSIERTARLLYSRLSDTDVKALMEAWDKMAVRLKTPTTAGD